MEMARLDAPLAHLGDAARLAGQRHLVLSCVDADTVIAAASLRGDLGSPIGVWLKVSPGYPPQLAARDVATLSWIVELDHVVISADVTAPSHAQVVRALLTDDEVNFANDVATLVGAYNRPAPPRELRVWSWDGSSLHCDADTLTLQSRVAVDVGELSTFA